MAQSFDETAHLKTDMKAYHEGWERIFGGIKHDKCQPYEDKLQQLESQLQIAMSALNKIYDTDKTVEDMERTASSALSDIEGVE